jgi:hypothetical protein
LGNREEVIVRGSFSLLAASIAGLIWLAFVLYFSLSDRDSVKDLTQIIQASVTSVAIVMGGFFAIVKLELFRDFAPHLTIGHQISHRRIGNSYVHVGVVVTLRNSSKVAMKIRRGEYLVQQVSPVTDAKIESLNIYLPDAESNYIEWPVLDEQERIWNEEELIIDPGESRQEAFESVIPRHTDSILIYSYFNNQKYKPGFKLAQGWSATSFYDIVPAR